MLDVVVAGAPRAPRGDVAARKWEYVTITGTGEAGFDGQLMVPVAAIGDLIELLHSVPIPEGVE